MIVDLITIIEPDFFPLQFQFSAAAGVPVGGSIISLQADRLVVGAATAQAARRRMAGNRMTGDDAGE
jgi:hypothetical protein